VRRTRIAYPDTKQVNYPTDITDGAGAVTDTFAYDVFGAVTTRTGTTPTAWKFTGEQADDGAGDSGYYFLRARYYDPAVGRFTSRDPIAFAQRYAYVGGNPVVMTDPNGECFGEWWQRCKDMAQAAAHRLGTLTLVDFQTQPSWELMDECRALGGPPCIGPVPPRTVITLGEAFGWTGENVIDPAVRFGANAGECTAAGIYVVAGGISSWNRRNPESFASAWQQMGETIATSCPGAIGRVVDGTLFD
jgi:RHS repeat-associated protein